MKRQFSWRQIIIGAILAAGGLGAGVVYFGAPDSLVFAVLMLAGLGGGGFLLYRGIRAGKNVAVVTEKGVQAIADVNAIVIRKRTLTLDHLEDPKGFPVRVKNNGKLWHLYWERPDDTLEPYELPDGCQYFDPQEYASALSMPAHRKLFSHRQSLLEQLTPGFLAIGMIIAGIVLIAVE